MLSGKSGVICRLAHPASFGFFRCSLTPQPGQYWGKFAARAGSRTSGSAAASPPLAAIAGGARSASR